MMALSRVARLGPGLVLGNRDGYLNRLNRLARHLRAILEHASPVLGSGLGKRCQAGGAGIVTRVKPGPPGRGPRRPGALSVVR